MSNCLKVEQINKKSRDDILTEMKNIDSEVSKSQSVTKYLVNIPASIIWTCDLALPLKAKE